MEHNSGVNEVFKIFKRSMVRATEQVTGCEFCGKGKKGGLWWTEKIKEATGDI